MKGDIQVAKCKNLLNYGMQDKMSSKRETKLKRQAKTSHPVTGLKSSGKTSAPLRAIFFIPYLILIPTFYLNREFQWSKTIIAYLSLFPPIIFLLGKGTKILRTKSLAVMTLLFVWSAITLLWAENIFESLRLGVVIMPGLLCYVIALTVLKGDRKEFNLLLSASTLASFIVAVVGLSQYFGLIYTPNNQFGQPDPGSLLGLTSYSTEYLMITIPAQIALVVTNRKIRPLFLLSLLICSLYLLITMKRAAYIGFFASLFWLLLLVIWQEKVKRKRIIEIFAISIILLGIGLTITKGKMIPRFLSSFNFSDPSVAFRLKLWEQALHMIVDNPLGVGIGNFAVARWQYNTQEFEEMMILASPFGSAFSSGPAHNEFINITADIGIPGLFIFLSIIILLFFTLRRSMIEHNDDHDMRWFIISISSGIVGLLVFMSFHYSLQNIASSSHFWLWCALLGAAGKGKKNTKILEYSRYIVFSLCLTVIVGLYVSCRIYLSQNHLRIAQRYNVHGRIGYAINEYEQVIKYDPSNAKAHFDMAVIKMRQNDMKGADLYFKKFLEYSPYNGWARRFHGEVLFNMRFYKDALDEFERALKYHPTGRAEIYAYMSAISNELGEPNNARKYAEKALVELGMVSNRLVKKGVIKPFKVLQLVNYGVGVEIP